MALGKNGFFTKRYFLSPTVGREYRGKWRMPPPREGGQCNAQFEEGGEWGLLSVQDILVHRVLGGNNNLSEATLSHMRGPLVMRVDARDGATNRRRYRSCRYNITVNNASHRWSYIGRAG